MVIFVVLRTMRKKKEIIDTSNREFKQALELISKTNQSLFLTGKAGTGKSTFLRYICENVQKKHIVLAPTGIAAINVGGQTIHSFFKAPFRPVLPDDADLSTTNGRIFDFLKYTKKHQKLIQELEMVIIDEISMVRADIIDFIDRVLRVYSHNLRVPFGGKQLVMVGDVFQLEPVVKSDEWAILNRFYKSPFFFSANVFSQIQLVSIELTKVYRQKNQEFISLLDSVRVNQISTEMLNALNARFEPDFETDENTGRLYITLATRKDTVDYINDRNLKKLTDASFFYEGKIEGEFNENNLPTPKLLELKVDAQVMFIKNDPERRWVNGTLGRISFLDAEEIAVILEDGEEVFIEKVVWRNIKYEFNEKQKTIEEKELGHFVQYPLRLAWAVTVHKSQGLTFDRVVVDMGSGAFAAGQTYVALSRCTSLDGIVLKQRLQKSDVFVRPEVQQFAQQFNDEKQISQSIEIAEANKMFVDALILFKKGNFTEATELFYTALNVHNILQNPLYRRFIAFQTAKMARYKLLFEREVAKFHRTTDEFKEMAKEFIAMGDESLASVNDPQAAIANYTKAIKLSPSNAEVLTKRGLLYQKQKKYHEAELDFSEVVKLKKKDYQSFLQRGKLYMLTKNYPAAIDDFNKAVILNPRVPLIFRLLGDAYSKTGNLSKAAECWAKAGR